MLAHTAFSVCSALPSIAPNPPPPPSASCRAQPRGPPNRGSRKEWPFSGRLLLVVLKKTGILVGVNIVIRAP